MKTGRCIKINTESVKKLFKIVKFESFYCNILMYFFRKVPCVICQSLKSQCKERVKKWIFVIFVKILKEICFTDGLCCCCCCSFPWYHKLCQGSHGHREVKKFLKLYSRPGKVMEFSIFAKVV